MIYKNSHHEALLPIIGNLKLFKVNILIQIFYINYL